MGLNNAWRLATDAAGNLYTKGHLGTTPQRLYVAKLNAAGTALVYATYLGGRGRDVGHGIAVDQAGQLAFVQREPLQDDSGPGGLGGRVVEVVAEAEGPPLCGS